ncbi:conjugative transposon protein TraM [Mucilaginibacter defluvii]|uniref:Conjugative transposon TraM C-terminal domain-containing protein n=1 Tax=Mucilaginibacter defluvii TaxID=1196019 RepID=A0ABP9FNU9_9SPHI|nr:conjugative transposon protein TraM [Bacteroidota bacterium]
MKTKNNPQELRKRKFLLIMPLIVFPFLALLFWVFGGGKGEQSKAAAQGGLSMKLPGSMLTADTANDKLGFYEKARADSNKQEQLRRTDPFFKRSLDSAGVFSANPQTTLAATSGSDDDPNTKAAQITQKLAALQTEINKPPVKAAPIRTEQVVTQPYPVPASTLAEDPEMKQLNGMLEKLLELQNPNRGKPATETGTPPVATERFMAIPAVIDGNQKIVQGTVIRMRLLDSVRLNGEFFPKGHLIYGSGDLTNQRVKIHIKLIHMGLQIIPVDLTVFDRTDGLEGISVPEAVTGDALRNGAVNGVQSMDIMSFDPSMSAQLATAGINTAKGLFSKKVKRVKGKLKNGHTLLLRDNDLIKAVR